MSKNNMPQTLPTTVDFHGNKLLTIQANGVEYVAMKPIIEGIGIQWETQRLKLVPSKGTTDNHGTLKFGIVVLPFPSPGGTQETICIPLRKLNGWLFSINPAKIPNPDIRAKVVLYQEECFQVLHDYWHKGECVNPRAELPEVKALQRRLEGLSRQVAAMAKHEKPKACLPGSEGVSSHAYRLIPVDILAPMLGMTVNKMLLGMDCGFHFVTNLEAGDNQCARCVRSYQLEICRGQYQGRPYLTTFGLRKLLLHPKG